MNVSAKSMEKEIIGLCEECGCFCALVDGSLCEPCYDNMVDEKNEFDYLDEGKGVSIKDQCVDEIRNKIHDIQEKLVHYEYAGETQECIICREKIQKNDVCISLPCLHTYHSECVHEWLHKKTTCPMCRTSI